MPTRWQSWPPPPDGAAWHFQAGAVSALPAVPEPRLGAAVAVAGATGYVLGGLAPDGSTVTRTARAINLAVAPPVWTPVAELPRPRVDAAAVRHAERIVVLGGTGAGGAPVTEIDVYDPATGSWSTPANDLPDGRIVAATSSGGSEIVVLQRRRAGARRPSTGTSAGWRRRSRSSA